MDAMRFGEWRTSMWNRIIRRYAEPEGRSQGPPLKPWRMPSRLIMSIDKSILDAVQQSTWRFQVQLGVWPHKPIDVGSASQIVSQVNT